MPHVYISNADCGHISVLHMAHDGHLHLQNSVPVGGNLMPMAISPNRQVLYAVRRSEPMAVSSWAIDPASRDLQLLGEAALPASMAYISTDVAGRFLFAASYPGHQLTVSPIALDGTVGPVQQVLPTGPYAHAIVTSPCQRYVLATALGGGELMVLDVNADSGRLTPAASWTARAGAGPRHFRFDPQGRRVYLLHELDGTVDVLDWDADQAHLSWVQTVSILPPGFAGQPWAADLHLTPDGRHLYTSERTSSTLAHFRVDVATGTLALQGHTSVETQPRGFAIDSTGRHLLVVGQLSHHLSRWAIEPDTGQLALQQRLAVGQGPNWVEILA